MDLSQSFFFKIYKVQCCIGVTSNKRGQIVRYDVIAVPTQVCGYGTLICAAFDGCLGM